MTQSRVQPTTPRRKYLKRATAWQSVWIANKAGLLTDRENATRLTSDTQSIERKDRADVMLAPLARMEIMNLSWIGTRSQWLPPVSLAAMRRNFLNEKSDTQGTWEPL